MVCNALWSYQCSCSLLVIHEQHFLQSFGYLCHYLDDILIYSNNMFQHHQHVKEVLKHLCKANLYAKAEKCEFHSELVEYLGYILSSSGLTMSNNKVKIIQDWTEPKKVKNIQSFLGFANFYCWSIFNYSDIVIPSIHLTQKDILWKFNSIVATTRHKVQ